ncbi:ABC transporter permease [Glutamicibacter uratoxydans]|uniref:ABC transporter permease n=1 Tax=Glutamicibacter uratoxydans TaxID=43667 RepID=A0A4Y4DLD4_GLUUR|nr:methionine ABC transporter permease [Glutamicibacter uratoxydans]GED06132.1 ABC transporter permease [Glutamicibacter uratoxydans]
MGTTNWELLWPKIWTALLQTLQMVTIAMVLASIFGVLLGLVLYSTRPGHILANKFVFALLNGVINVIRPIPFIIFIVAIGPLTRAVIGTTIGTNAAIFALTIVASLSIARIVENNLVAVDPGAIEAGRAMGARPLRILFTIVVPEGLGALILGLTYMMVALIDATAVAGLVGGGGLGDLAMVYGYQRFDSTVMLVIIVFLIILVQLAQYGGNALSRKILRRG